jgi:hypothetical protein
MNIIEMHKVLMFGNYSVKCVQDWTFVAQIMWTLSSCCMWYCYVDVQFFNGITHYPRNSTSHVIVLVYFSVFYSESEETR